MPLVGSILVGKNPEQMNHPIDPSCLALCPIKERKRVPKPNRVQTYKEGQEEGRTPLQLPHPRPHLLHVCLRVLETVECLHYLHPGVAAMTTLGLFDCKNLDEDIGVWLHLLHDSLALVLALVFKLVVTSPLLLHVPNLCNRLLIFAIVYTPFLYKKYS